MKMDVKRSILVVLFFLMFLVMVGCEGSNYYPGITTYSVTYDANTGTGDVPVDGNDYEEGDAVTVLGSGTLTKDGYTFGGWNTEADGSGTTYQEGDEFPMGEEDITLYAIWNRDIGGLGVLVVRNDTTAGDAMIAALAANNYLYVATDRATFEAMSIDGLFEYDAVFYAGGSSGDSWAKAMAYLDAGGRFFIADNDLGWSQGGTTFYQTYLQAIYHNDSGSDGVPTGMSIMNGINPGISADPWPDDFTVGAQGVQIFSAPSGYSAGVSIDRNGYRAVYLAWDFQYIADTNHENAIIDRIAMFLGVPRNVPLAIGNNYGGGVVAYILQNGDPGYDARVQHGLIAATADQSASIEWHATNGDATGATAQALGTGQANTNLIVGAYGLEANAAKLCDDYSVVVNSVTYNDWFLPSYDELGQLYTARATIGGFASSHYWSSSEWTGGSSAMNIDFSDGTLWIQGKNTLNNRVRAVRYF